MASTRASWLNELSPLVFKLRDCADMMVRRARTCLMFARMEELAPNVVFAHVIKQRRDVVFAQALTALVAAVMTSLQRADADLLKQYVRLGILFQVEGLLSCHSDEQGMIEDLCVGVRDLSKVAINVKEADSEDSKNFVVSGNRLGYTVTLALSKTRMSEMPLELQQGHCLKVVPVVFNVGINEHASFAERFGDVSFQEQLNIESFAAIAQYFELHNEVMHKPDAELKSLVQQLHFAVYSKKPKNVEVLQLAQEITWRLRGLRLTCCKSGKDRTSMSVTLENTQMLQRIHRLSPDAFMHALQTLRSQGTRRDNTQKNTGTRRYAFNSLQLLSLPKLYRPPHGTYGNTQT